MKNLIYIFADQWRYHAMGCTGEDPVSTPNMDSFAKDSLFCTSAVSTYPLCSPHRAALLTGKHPLNTGFYTNCKIGIRDKITLAPEEIAITDVLHDSGYINGYIGKWHLDSSEKNYYKCPSSGASNWDAYTPKGERRHHIDYWHSYGAYDQHLAPHYWEDSDKMINVDKWSPEHEIDKAIEFVEKNKSVPFSLFISWNPPHPPYDKVPGKYLSLYPDVKHDFRDNVPLEWREDDDYLKKRQEYFAAVSGLDYEFGRFISYLKEKNLYDNTTIILSADHGDMMGSHGLYGKNVWYEESLRIPLIIHDSFIDSGSYDGMIASEDQMPTILDILGIDIPDTVEGKSHYKAFYDNSCVREYTPHCMIPGLPELVAPFSRLGLDYRAFGWRAIRDKDHTYVIDNGTSPSEKQVRLLYDNKSDPFQENPEILDPSDRRAVFYDELLRMEAEKTSDDFLMERK